VTWLSTTKGKLPVHLRANLFFSLTFNWALFPDASDFILSDSFQKKAKIKLHAQHFMSIPSDSVDFSHEKEKDNPQK